MVCCMIVLRAWWASGGVTVRTSFDLMERKDAGLWPVERGGKRGKEREKGRRKEGVITRRRDGEEKWRE